MYADHIISHKDCKFIFSDLIDDGYYNFLFDFKCASVDDAEKILKKNSELFIRRGRVPRIYVVDNNENKQIIPKLMKKYDVFDSDTWFCTEIANINFAREKIADVSVELSNDRGLVVELVKKGFSTKDANDPYGFVPDCYWQELYNNFGKCQNGFKTFHFVGSLKGRQIGVASAVVKGKFAYLNNLCVQKPYRQRGVANSIIKEMLNFLKSHGVEKTIFLTEKNGYPAKIYKKMGFLPMCDGYCFEMK